MRDVACQITLGARRVVSLRVCPRTPRQCRLPLIGCGRHTTCPAQKTVPTPSHVRVGSPYHFDIAEARNTAVSNIVLRGISDRLHRELTTAAQRNHRSLNGEILSRLTASVHDVPVDAAALGPETVPRWKTGGIPGLRIGVFLERIQHRHETLGKIDLSEASLRNLRNTGQP